SQSRVPNGGFAPFGNPHKKRRYATPPRGAYRLFLLSSPPAVSVEQKSAWDWCGIFNYVKLPLHNRTLHISGTFKEAEKTDIEAAKPDIVDLKADIEAVFQPKTARHILKLREAFPGQTIFGRSDVMKAIDIKASRASDLLKEMVEHGIIEPVSGHGKGKYRFRHQES
ncbi:MAG: hypothetical protein MR934_03470, partial [Clostridium sp.]|nr:hypothetical protein [Clostridium sp.]